MDGNEVKEGYLCPICVKDLGNIEELTAHFESTHSSEEKDVLQSLKGLIGRAKRKILKEKDFNESRTDDDDNGPPSNYSSRLTWDYQEIGTPPSIYICLTAVTLGDDYYWHISDF